MVRERVVGYGGWVWRVVMKGVQGGFEAPG